MSDDQSEATFFDRKESSSGGPDHGSPVVLHESSKMRQTLVPFYIERSSGNTEFSCKLVTYRKAPAPMNWAIDEEKSISLQHIASRELLRALESAFAVADENDRGQFFVMRLENGEIDKEMLQNKELISAVGQALTDEEIVEHVKGRELDYELTTALQTSIRLSEMRAAVAQLREMLDAEVVAEQRYQDWCEAHSWAFGNAYVMTEEVRQIAVGDNLDLMVQDVITGFRDVIELKRPNHSVLNYDNSHRNYYFSADVSKALGQCHRYLDVFHEEAASGLRDSPDIVAYHPRATIVVGRSNDWEDDKLRALHGLNRRLSSIAVMTYDQLLAQGERMLNIVAQEKDQNDDEWEIDDMPF